VNITAEPQNLPEMMYNEFTDTLVPDTYDFTVPVLMDDTYWNDLGGFYFMMGTQYEAQPFEYYADEWWDRAGMTDFMIFDVDLTAQGNYTMWMNVSDEQGMEINDDTYWYNVSFSFSAWEFMGMIVDPVEITDPAFIGDDVEVDVYVNNTGAQEGNFTLLCTFEGDTASDNATIAVGEEAMYSFVLNTTGLTEGNYDIDFELYVNDTMDTSVLVDMGTTSFDLWEPVGDITGFVVYENETSVEIGVAGIEVWAFNETLNETFMTTTNATGYYAFMDLEPYTYTVWVNDTFYYAGDSADFMVEKGITLINANLTIEYYVLGFINGTVKNAMGEPIEGADVVLDEDDSFAAVTDENGTYEIAGLPVDSYHLTATADGYYEKTLSAEVDADGVTVDFVLEDWMGTIYGWVFYEMAGANNTTALEPIVGAKVMAGEINTTTNVTGYYELMLPLMAHLVVVNATGFVDKNATVTLDTMDQMEMKNFTLVPFIPPPPAIVDGIFSGRVNNTDGVNLSSIEIVIWKEWVDLVNVSGNMTNVTMFKYFNVTTDTGGNFTTARLLLGKYMWEINATGYDVQSGDFELTAIANMVKKNITLIPAIVPVQKYALTITVTPVDATLKIDGVVKTLNATGVFVMEVEDGVYSIEVSKTGYVTQKENVTVAGAAVSKTYTLVESGPTLYTLIFGPVLKKGTGLLDLSFVEGVEVSFTIDGVNYTGTTDALGLATMSPKAPFAAIPAGTVVTLEKDGKKTTITTKDGDLFFEFGSKKDDGGSNVLLFVIIAVVVVIIIVVLIVVMKGKKKEPEVPPELEEEMAEGEEGELEEGEGMAEDKEAVEEGGEDLDDVGADEPEEEMEGVEDEADDLDDFDDESDEDFDDEVGDDYEDDLDEDEDL
jgi:hypothetical protein